MFFKEALSWFVWLFTGKKSPYKTVYIEELPDQLKKNHIYVLGEREHLWEAAILCPCGCGETLHMSLHREGRPRWKVEKHKNGTVSLYPSVWRKVGCRSHFYFRKGYIEWCRE